MSIQINKAAITNNDVVDFFELWHIIRLELGHLGVFPLPFPSVLPLPFVLCRLSWSGFLFAVKISKYLNCATYCTEDSSQNSVYPIFAHRLPPFPLLCLYYG